MKLKATWFCLSVAVSALCHVAFASTTKAATVGVPTIESLNSTDGNLIMRATNGEVSGVYYLVSSTNNALPPCSIIFAKTNAIGISSPNYR